MGEKSEDQSIFGGRFLECNPILFLDMLETVCFPLEKDKSIFKGRGEKRKVVTTCLADEHHILS